jgi:hypothetical protein
MTYILDQYAKAFPGEPPPLDPKRVAGWAWGKGIWRPIETAPEEVLRRKLSRALRHTYVTDPQGREVRANVAVIEEVMTPDGPKRMARFYPLFKASAEVMRQQLALDRKQALATVHQMKLDFDSWTDNNERGEVLAPLDLDFNKDIEEMDLPSDYEPDQYGDDDGDE